MTEIIFDKYTQKYFLKFTESNIVALDFTQVETLAEQLREICMEQYAMAIQFEPLDDCGSGACKI